MKIKKLVEWYYDDPVIKRMIKKDFDEFLKESYQRLSERQKRRVLYKMFGKEFRDSIVAMNEKKK